MEISRRGFLKLSGAGTAALLFFKGGVDWDAVSASNPIPLRKKVGETTTVCCFDATGCGFIVAAEDGNIVDIEGDPDHPINRGAACSKGGSLAQLRTVDGKLNPRRLTKVQYRAPGADKWQEVSWDWALDRIAQKIKATRDANWITTDSNGMTVNRTEALTSLGGSALDNEECYLLSKMARALGIVYLEHHARI
jgi:formate dehydrogenase major subunit